MLRIIISDHAELEIQEAYFYLKDKEKDLGEKLLSPIYEYFSLIELRPLVFKKGYRQVRISPFQYLLRYKIEESGIFIIQLFHARLNPRKKEVLNSL